MSLSLPKTCAMGSSQTGLAGTIGITLLNPDGTTHTARATVGIYEIGGGCYGKEVTFDNNWKGSILWDTGGGAPVYATEDYDVECMIIKHLTDIKGSGWTDESLEEIDNLVSKIKSIVDTNQALLLSD